MTRKANTELNTVLDDYGYPTVETLELIQEWPVHTKEDGEQLLSFCAGAWSRFGWWKMSAGKHKVNTGGWSGNESLLGALQRNTIFWILCWKSSHRGGYYEFQTHDD